MPISYRPAVVAAILLLAPLALAQAAPAGAIVLVTKAHEPMDLIVALSMAANLRAVGADVQLVFQGEGVLALAALSDIDIQRKMLAARTEAPVADGGAPRYLRNAPLAGPVRPKTKALFVAAKKAGLKVVACLHSATRAELADDLRKAGVELSGDADEMLNLAPQFVAGRQLLIF